MAYNGVLVSLKPRKTPCMAKERRTAGAPSDLSVKYLFAGPSIGDPYNINEKERGQNLVLLFFHKNYLIPQ